jgi:hypothetical protein
MKFDVESESLGGKSKSIPTQSNNNRSASQFNRDPTFGTKRIHQKKDDNM